MNTDKAWIYYNSPRICPQAQPEEKHLWFFTDTPTAKARWVLIYVNFQIYSKVYKTSLFL